MTRQAWKLYAVLAVVHFALTVLGGVFLPGLAVGMMDSGVVVAPWWFYALAYVDIAVSLPLVLPLMMADFIHPWTLRGFYLLLPVALANSMVVTVPASLGSIHRTSFASC